MLDQQHEAYAEDDYDLLLDTAFEVECPRKKQSTALARSRVTDTYEETDTPNPDLPLSITFTITPGSRWREMRKYRNVNCEPLTPFSSRPSNVTLQIKTSN
jgi:hypothetical protein